MADAKTTPFFMLDGTFEYQKGIANRIANGLPLEMVAEYFARNGMELPKGQSKERMKERSDEFRKRYGL